MSESLLSTSEVDSFLAHHGVKGQKWGVRKTRSSGAGRKVGTLTSTHFSGGQKAGIIAGGAVGFLGAHFLTRYSSRSVNLLAKSVGTSIGAGAVAHFMKKHAKTTVYDVRSQK